MPPLDLPSLAPGDRVQHELLVVERAERRTAGGDPYLVVTLANRTGRLETAPVWSDRLDWAAGAEPGRVVQAVGEVALYGRGGQARRQLVLAAPLRALPPERFSIDEFLPHVDEPPARLWAALDRLRTGVRAAPLRRVLDLFFCDESFRDRFARAPGSTTGHHARVGGLLQHTLEVAHIGQQSARAVRRVNGELLVAGALLHDVGKLEAYEVGAAGFGYTPRGLLVGHVVLGLLMLERRVAAEPVPPCSDGQLLELQHLVLSHHGKREFGSPVEPMTVEAELLHWADEASAKGTDFLDALDDPELWAEGGELSRRSWRLGRRVWRPGHGWE